MDGNLGALSVGVLDAWKMISEALKPTDSKLSKDWETLEVVNTIIANESATLNHLFTIINASTDAEIVNAKNGSFNLNSNFSFLRIM